MTVPWISINGSWRINQDSHLKWFLVCSCLRASPEDLSEFLMPPVLLCAHLVVQVPAEAEAWPLLGLLVNVLLSGLHIFWDLHRPWNVPILFPGTPRTWTQYCEVCHAH